MADTKGPEIAIRRSMLGRARGLGAAKSGTAHWWAMKATSLALIPLTLWMRGSMIGLQGATRAPVSAWAGRRDPAPLARAALCNGVKERPNGARVTLGRYRQSTPLLYLDSSWAYYDAKQTCS